MSSRVNNNIKKGFAWIFSFLMEIKNTYASINIKTCMSDDDFYVAKQFFTIDRLVLVLVVAVWQRDTLLLPWSTSTCITQQSMFFMMNAFPFSRKKWLVNMIPHPKIIFFLLINLTDKLAPTENRNCMQAGWILAKFPLDIKKTGR